MKPRLPFSRRRGAAPKRRKLSLCVEQLEERQLLSRSILSLDNSWQFIRQDVTGAETVSYNDSAWSTVSLPHTWNNLDGQDGGSNYYRGIGWYRKHYTVPANLSGQELFIKFDGANLITDFYVNGAFVGEHVGGSAAFVWDLTPFLKVGADNVLAVKVNNAQYLGAIPLSGDITWDGGLYRHVNLIATDPLHVSLTDYAGPGVYLQQTNVSAASADLQITTKVQNDSLTSRPATVIANILDASGHFVQALASNVTVAAGAEADVVEKTTLAHPHLWNGRSDPYMYQVLVYIFDSAAPAVTDYVEQPLGLRYFSVDPNNGFFLNGQYLDLHGVGYHQDHLNEGWAISDADQVQDVSMIQEIGATFVRLVYYQRPQKTYDLLDAAGIVTQTDIGLNDYVLTSSVLFENIKQQLRELIRQNYNHPSILFWGLYDELAENPQADSWVAQLVQIAHQEDPTRLATGATNLPDNKPLNFLTDVTGFNKYYGWYYGTAYDVGPWADAFHSAHPTTAIGLSEYGAGASAYQHQSNAWYPQYPARTWHPEEYQDTFHEVYWKQLASRPFLWVKSVWDMFDFAADSRAEGDTPGRNDKGLVTYDRQTRKDAFYWYKANWSSDPVLYITSRGYINRPSNVVDIKIYSNLDAVQLSVNGVVVGTASSTDHIFLWKGVTLAPGANAIEVTAKQHGVTYTDDVTWYAPLQLGGVPFARINFQPAGVPVPTGYVPDYGYAFGDRGNGFSYGWDTDNSANTYARGVASDPRYDTGIAMQSPTGGHVWQIAVPNGTYIIHMVSGDPSNYDSIDEIAVQGALAVSGGVNILSRYEEAWRTVTVTNGVLTITNASGSSNDNLDFIDINRISGGGHDATPLSSGKGGDPLLVPMVENRGATETALSSDPGSNSVPTPMPLVVTDAAAIMAKDPQVAVGETQASVSRSASSQMAVDSADPVFDDKTRSWLQL
jgi:beta-galactosidase